MLVTCVMPTRDRPAFVRQSIWYFLRQDYGARELLILDDGHETVANLVPRDPRIRYVRLAKPTSVPAKHNLGCELAAGQLIAHWDDDDWIAPHRLSAQVGALTEKPYDVCVIGDVIHYRLREGQALRLRTPDLFGGTLVYRKEAWRAHPFATDSHDEVRAFIDGFDSAKVTDCRGAAAYVAVAHPGVSSPRQYDDSRWERRPIHELGSLLGPDADFYTRLRTASGAARVPPPAISRVRVAAPFFVYDGYGSMAEYLVLGMLRAGATVDVTPFRLDLRWQVSRPSVWFGGEMICGDSRPQICSSTRCGSQAKFQRTGNNALRWPGQSLFHRGLSQMSSEMAASRRPSRSCLKAWTALCITGCRGR